MIRHQPLGNFHGAGRAETRWHSIRVAVHRKMAVASCAAVSGPMLKGVFGQCSGAVFRWGWFIPSLQMMRWWHGVCAFFNQHPVKKEPKLLWFHVGLSRSKKPVESADSKTCKGNNHLTCLAICNYLLPWVLGLGGNPPKVFWNKNEVVHPCRVEDG